MDSDQKCPETCGCEKKDVNRIDEVLNSPLISFLSKWGKTVTWGLAGVMLLALWFGYQQVKSRKQAEQDYANAHIASENIQRHSPTSDQSLQTLRSLVQQYPLLHHKYDGIIAQSLIARQEGKEAKAYAENVLHQNPEIAHSIYGKYANVSLLILDEEYPKALEKSLNLREELAKQGAHLPSSHLAMLYFANLLRIASLHQTLNDAIAERSDWQAIESWLDSAKQDGSRISKYLKAFDIGLLSLEDYILNRKTSLMLAES